MGAPRVGLGRDTQRDTLQREWQRPGRSARQGWASSEPRGRGTLGPDAPSGGSCDVLQALFNKTPRVGRDPAFPSCIPVDASCWLRPWGSQKTGRAGQQGTASSKGFPRAPRAHPRHSRSLQEGLPGTVWTADAGAHHAGRRRHLQHRVLADRTSGEWRGGPGGTARGMRPGGQ